MFQYCFSLIKGGHSAATNVVARQVTFRAASAHSLEMVMEEGDDVTFSHVLVDATHLPPAHIGVRLPSPVTGKNEIVTASTEFFLLEALRSPRFAVAVLRSGTKYVGMRVYEDADSPGFPADFAGKRARGVLSRMSTTGGYAVREYIRAAPLPSLAADFFDEVVRAFQFAPRWTTRGAREILGDDVPLHEAINGLHGADRVNLYCPPVASTFQLIDRLGAHFWPCLLLTRRPHKFAAVDKSLISGAMYGEECRYVSTTDDIFDDLDGKHACVETALAADEGMHDGALAWRLSEEEKNEVLVDMARRTGIRVPFAAMRWNLVIVDDDAAPCVSLTAFLNRQARKALFVHAGQPVFRNTYSLPAPAYVPVTSDFERFAATTFTLPSVAPALRVNYVELADPQGDVLAKLVPDPDVDRVSSQVIPALAHSRCELHALLGGHSLAALREVGARHFAHGNAKTLGQRLRNEKGSTRQSMFFNALQALHDGAGACELCADPPAVLLVCGHALCAECRDAAFPTPVSRCPTCRASLTGLDMLQISTSSTHSPGPAVTSTSRLDFIVKTLGGGAEAGDAEAGGTRRSALVVADCPCVATVCGSLRQGLGREWEVREAPGFYGGSPLVLVVSKETLQGLVDGAWALPGAIFLLQPLCAPADWVASVIRTLASGGCAELGVYVVARRVENINSAVHDAALHALT